MKQKAKPVQIEHNNIFNGKRQKRGIIGSFHDNTSERKNKEIQPWTRKKSMQPLNAQWKQRSSRPLFFIHGSSVFALETEAVKTAETLKRCENMFFRGIVKYFSIKMPYFSDMAGSENFLARLDEMCVQAFDDQCTGANPRYPLMSEIKQMYLNAYYGGRHFEEPPMPTAADFEPAADPHDFKRTYRKAGK